MRKILCIIAIGYGLGGVLQIGCGLSPDEDDSLDDCECKSRPLRAGDYQFNGHWGTSEDGIEGEILLVGEHNTGLEERDIVELGFTESDGTSWLVRYVVESIEHRYSK